jgi:hypothetical protein
VIDGASDSWMNVLTEYNHHHNSELVAAYGLRPSSTRGTKGMETNAYLHPPVRLRGASSGAR